MREVVLRGWWYLRRTSKGFLVGFLPLLFLLISCSGGGGGSGGGQGILSVKLAFTPGDRQVEVNLVEKGPLVRLLNISTYQLTAIDSADEMMRIEGDRLVEETFNGSVLRGLTNDRNYTFALRVFYFPVGSAELSNLSLRIDYAEEANVQNIRDADGITIGSNRDGDYLADSLDADDDNDGLDDLDDSGRMLDRCPRGELGWQRNNRTDIDGDGCRDEGEDSDDDNDDVNDVMDNCPRGELGWRSNKSVDNDGDGCRDASEDDDDDNDMVADGEDLGEYEGRLCRLFVDCDGDGLMDNEDLGELNGKPCRIQPDCDGDSITDGKDSGEFMGTKCHLSVDCDKDGTSDLDDFGEHNGESCRVKPDDCDDDTIADELDVDIDGDGLIEIGMAVELDAVRWILNGSGRRLSEGAALDQTGCGDGAGKACGGYELVRDINLAAYAGGEGWAPLGNDTDSGTDGCQGTPFNGTFDGNGFAVRELNINRSGEDCIGLFGHLAAGTVIRNLTVRAEAVIGRDRVGGLVGVGLGAEIVSSWSVVGEVRGSDGVGGLVGVGSDVALVSSSSVVGGVRGSDFVGGLVGYGQSAELASSWSVVGEVRGSDNVGGLVGYGLGTELVSSSSVVGEVRGRNSVGGLVGNGFSAELVSSSAVADEVRGSSFVGGLVGYGDGAELASSSSVVGEVRGRNSVGGLVGYGFSAEIVSSWSVVGEVRGSSSVGGLVGRDGAVDASYWHTAVAVADNGKGEEKTLAELRTPTNGNAYDAGSIYANWADGANIRGGGEIEDITIYCDEDLSGDIETAEMRDGSMAGEDDNRIWDFGGTSDYPAIRCLPLSLTEQRSWWFINSTGHPNMNRTRLDALTSP